LNVAVTAFEAFIKIVQLVPLVEVQPDHPAKIEPVFGVAVSVTVLSALKSLVQVLPQLIPVGLLMTVPVPAPVLGTLRG